MIITVIIIISYWYVRSFVRDIWPLNVCKSRYGAQTNWLKYKRIIDGEEKSNRERRI